MSTLSSFIRYSAADRLHDSPWQAIQDRRWAEQIQDSSSYSYLIPLLKHHLHNRAGCRWSPDTTMHHSLGPYWGWIWPAGGVMLVHSNYDFTKDLQPIQVNSNQRRARDWGHFRDHENTVVWIDGKVRDLKDNGGLGCLFWLLCHVTISIAAIWYKSTEHQSGISERRYEIPDQHSEL